MGEPSLVPPDFFPPKKKYMTYEEAVHADNRFLAGHEDEPSEEEIEELYQIASRLQSSVCHHCKQFQQ